MQTMRIHLENELLPVQAYLNIWSDNDYLAMLRRMAQGIESTYNDVGWSWWGGEDGNPPRKGEVSFFMPGEEAVISATEAVGYVSQASETWLAKHPHHRDEVAIFLKQLGELLSVP